MAYKIRHKYIQRSIAQLAVHEEQRANQIDRDISYEEDIKSIHIRTRIEDAVDFSECPLALKYPYTTE